MENQISKLIEKLDNSLWYAVDSNFKYKFINNTVHINDRMIDNYYVDEDNDGIYLGFGGIKYYITILNDYELQLSDKKNFFIIERKL